MSRVSVVDSWCDEAGEVWKLFEDGAVWRSSREVPLLGPVHRRHAELAVAVGRMEIERADLARRLALAEQRLEDSEKREGRLQERLAIDRVALRELGEMWRGRYEAEKKARRELGQEALRQRQEALSGLARNSSLELVVGTLPAGEDPETRYGLTELGQRALAEKLVRGPAWVLLLSPDPEHTDVLSIEVKAGSRQEEIRRAAGWSTATEVQRGGNLLGLLEALVEVAKAEDAELGEVLHHVETLYLASIHGMILPPLAELVQDLRSWEATAAGDALPSPPRPPLLCGAVGPWATPCMAPAGHRTPDVHGDSEWHRTDDGRSWSGEWAYLRAKRTDGTFPGFTPPPGASWADFSMADGERLQRDAWTCQRCMTATLSRPRYARAPNGGFLCEECCRELPA